MAETTAQLQEKLKALTHGKVDIMLNADEFKSTTQILREMAAVWEEMTDMEQAAALELIGGKRQANILSSLISNFEVVEDVIETSMNSSGSAMIENAKWLDSIEGKTYQLTNAAQALWNDALSSDTIKGFLDVGLSATKVLDKIIDKIGLLGTAFAGVVGYLAIFKKHNPLAVMSDGWNRLQNTMYATTQVANIRNGFNAAGGGTLKDYNSANINAYAAAVSGLTAQQQAAQLAAAGLNAEQVKLALSTNGVTDAVAAQTVAEINFVTQKNAAVAVTKADIAATLAAKNIDASYAVEQWLLANSSEQVTLATLKQSLATSGLTTAQQKEIIAAFGLTAANKGLATSFKGIGAAMSLMWKTNPVGLLLTAITAVASIATIVAPALKDAFKSTEEKMQDLSVEWDELIGKVSDSSKNFKDVKTSADDVIPKFAKLAKGVDKFGKNVSLTDSEYKEFLSLNNQLADMFPEINNGMDENGNAMLSLSYNANNLEDSLWSLVDAKRAAANEEIADVLPDAAKNVKKTVKLYKKEENGLQDRIEAYKHAKEAAEEFNSAYIKQQYRDLYGDDWEKQWKIAASHSVDVGNLKLAFGADDNIDGWNDLLDKFTIDGEIDWYGVLNSTEMQNAISGVETQFENLQTKIQNKWNQLNPIVSAWANTDYTYQGLDGDLQNAAQAMMGNIDFSKYDTAEKIQDHIKNDILKPIDDLTPEAKKKLSKLMSIDASDLSVKEYQDKVKQTAEEFAAMQDKWSVSDILKNTGYQENLDAIDDIIYKIQNLEGVDINESDLLTLNANQISQAFDIVKKYGIKTFDDLQEALNNNTYEINVDITAEQEGFDALQTAIDEASSAAGLSSESIDKIQARYQSLANYDHATLFQETAHGIKLNAGALRELEKEYNNINADKLDDQLSDLTEQYNELTAEIADCTDASERANLYIQRQNVLDQINDTATLASQYRGLASAYNQWQRLKSGSSNKDEYEGVISGIKDMQEAMSRGWFDEWQISFVDMFTDSDTSKWGTEEYIKEWNRLRTETIGTSGFTVMDFFTTDKDGNSTTDGIYNLVDAIKAVNSEWVKTGENGKLVLDFGDTLDTDVAKQLGTSEEVLHILLNAAKAAGAVEVNIRSAYTNLADFKDNVTEVNDKLKALGATEYTFNINSTDLNDVEEQIEEAKKALANLKNEDGSLKVDAADYQNAQTLLATLIYQKQTLEKPAILGVDTSNAGPGIETVVKQLQDFKAAYNELEVKLAIGENTDEAQQKLDAAISALQQQNPEILATLGININQSSAEINSDINNITPQMLINAGLNTDLITDYQGSNITANGTVIWENNADKVTEWANKPLTKTGTVTWYNNPLYLTPPILGGGVGVNGTAHASGTAHAKGDWGAKKTETALVGELGPELVVRDNRWFTVGDNGAEFANIKKGDIIFNHKQTEQLLKNGYVTGRGKLNGSNSAFASGTAYAHVMGTGGGAGTISKTLKLVKDWFKEKVDSVKSTMNTEFSDVSVRAVVGAAKNGSDMTLLDPNTVKDNSGYQGSKSGGGGGGGGSDAKDEFEEVIDWVEIRIEEINEDLDLMAAKLENAVGYKNQNTILDDMIATNKILLENLENGAAEYKRYADKLLQEVPEAYREKAQDGAIKVEEFTNEADEKTVEAINNYREWVQKYADLIQQSEEIEAEIASLAKEKFDNISEQYENELSLIENINDQLDAQVSLMEDRGYVAAAEYYESMIQNTQQYSEQLEAEKQALQNVLDEQVKLGNIKKYSEEWYEMVDAIYEVDASIDDCTASLEEYQNAINDIYWDNFDELINRYDYLADETQNLIDLMENVEEVVADPAKRKYEGGTVEFWTEDDVKWTEEGMASLGLYAQQMEIAEKKAKEYAIAIEDLNEDYQAGKYSETEYLEKLNELKDAQYDSIDAYYEAQDAIKDLNEARIDSIREGVEKEVEAYEELIDKKKEALDAEKDLFDFQKNINEQQKDIAKIERQLAALQYDNSLSAIAKRKQLEAELAEANAELEETYYDRSIEDQKNALDKELEDFQEEKDAEIEKWEEYLDNIEQIVADSLTIVQANASGIYDTLSSKAEEYDLTLSEAILTPWQDGALAISDYQETFDTAASSTMDQLDAIKDKWQEVIDKMSEVAGQEISQQKQENATITAATKSEAKTSTSTSTQSNTYTVKSGDTLWDIATAKLGSGARWQEIYDLNRDIISNPDLIQPGWTLKLPKYAKGTTGVKGNQLAIIDELGLEELVMHADGSGKLAFLSKGSAVIPHDISENLMALGQLDPQDILERSRPVISAPHVTNNNIELNVTFGEVVHIDTVTNDTVPNLSKTVEKQIDKYMKGLNAEIRKFTR